LLIATLGGAAIGVERQHSGHASGPLSRFGGLRTFSLLGMAAGAAGLLWLHHYEVLGAILVSSAAALVLIGYWAASKLDIDATTEVAALVVLAAGLMAGLGWWVMASGMVAITSVLLSEKTRLHALTESLPHVGLQAGFRFALMALVILPLLPEGPYGPWGGIKPRELWMIVLLFSGLSFAGYAARCLVGAGQGYVVTGVLGGLVSSTNATWTLSRLSVSQPSSAAPLAIGVVAACTVMYVRVAVATLALNPNLGMVLLPYWIAPALVGLAMSAYGMRRKDMEAESGPLPHNPLEIGAALQMALLFQVVLFLIEAVKRFWGGAGLLVSGAVLGLTDVDALTISMARSSMEPDQLATAATAIAIGCLANTCFKLGIALVIGRGNFRRAVAVGFGLLILGAGAGFGLGHWRVFP
jgi:uncharacterized membrane protein (DUF4010 family)